MCVCVCVCVCARARQAKKETRHRLMFLIVSYSRCQSGLSVDWVSEKAWFVLFLPLGGWGLALVKHGNRCGAVRCDSIRFDSILYSLPSSLCFFPPPPPPFFFFPPPPLLSLSGSIVTRTCFLAPLLLPRGRRELSIVRSLF